MTIIDQHIVHLLTNIRNNDGRPTPDLGKVLVDSLLRAQIYFDGLEADGGREAPPELSH